MNVCAKFKETENVTLLANLETFEICPGKLAINI